MLDVIKRIVETNFLGSSILQYITAIVCAVALWILIMIYGRMLGRAKKKSYLRLSGLFQKVVLVSPLLFLSLMTWLETLLVAILLSTIAREGIRIITAMISYALQHYVSKKDQLDETSANAIMLTIKIILWIVAVLMILSNLGVEIAPLGASLGIGSIAIAFALQNILKDIFSSFSIFLDKPFKVGDFISFDTYRGTITDISLKSTRVRSLDGEELVIPNSKVMDTIINNFDQISKRRIQTQLTFVYHTDVQQLVSVLREIPSILEKEQPATLVQIDRCHIVGCADAGIVVEVVAFVHDSSFMVFIQQRELLLVQLLAIFQQHNMQLAYPTQTVLVQADSAATTSAPSLSSKRTKQKQ